MAKASMIAAKEAQAQADQAASMKALQDTVALLLETVMALDAKVDHLIEAQMPTSKAAKTKNV